MNETIFQKVVLSEGVIVYSATEIKDFKLTLDELNALWDLHPECFHVVKMFGKEVKTPRWQQAYGKNYNYTGSRNNALPVPDILEPFLSWCKTNIDARLNGLLLNWYDGQKRHYIGAHRDDTRDLQEGSPIVTISLGQERTFRLREYGGNASVDIRMANASVIVIPWETNKKWTHEVPHFQKYNDKRISITLRAFK